MILIVFALTIFGLVKSRRQLRHRSKVHKNKLHKIANHIVMSNWRETASSSSITIHSHLNETHFSNERSKILLQEQLEDPSILPRSSFDTHVAFSINLEDGGKQYTYTSYAIRSSAETLKFVLSQGGDLEIFRHKGYPKIIFVNINRFPEGFKQSNGVEVNGDWYLDLYRTDDR